MAYSRPSSLGLARFPFLPQLLARAHLRAPAGQVSIGAAGGRSQCGVADVGHQRAGRGPDHALEVEAGVSESGDGQRSLRLRRGVTRGWRNATLWNIRAASHQHDGARRSGWDGGWDSGEGDRSDGTTALPLCSWGSGAWAFSISACPSAGMDLSTPGVPRSRVCASPVKTHRGQGCTQRCLRARQPRCTP